MKPKLVRVMMGMPGAAHCDVLASALPALQTSIFPQRLLPPEKAPSCLETFWIFPSSS